MTQRLYKFNWGFIGDLKIGRPNLGNMVNVEMYRLFQYTLRDVLEEELGTEKADMFLYKSGLLAGKEFYEKYIGECDSMNDFVEKLQNKLRSMNIGILRIEQADVDNMQFVLTVAEDLDCAGLPDIAHSVCTYDEGFIGGLFESFTGRQFSAKEIDCWCTGDRVCRFEVNPTKGEA